MSIWTPTALPPCSTMSSASLRVISTRRAARATVAPCADSSCAAWRPMPEEAPVTITVWPFMLKRLPAAAMFCRASGEEESVMFILPARHGATPPRPP